MRGVVAEKGLDGSTIALEVGGVGYGLRVTLSDFNVVLLGGNSKFFVYEHIREDAHDLYGFLQTETKVLFELLLGVKNVGPKAALAILGIGEPGSVRRAIASGDVKMLQTAKGVGKRAAEQVVVELRDKVGLIVSDEAENMVTRGAINVSDEATQALVALGYSEVDAQIALQRVSTDLPIEERIKEALRY